MKYFCEIELATNSNYVHSAGNGIFNASFPNATTFVEGCKLKIGVKPDIKFPKLQKEITFKALLVSKMDAYDLEKQFLPFTITYESNDELAYLVEACARSTLRLDQHIALDFAMKQGPFRQHLHIATTLLSLTYKYDRFLLELHRDLNLILSDEISKELMFTEEILGNYTAEEIKKSSEDELIQSWKKPVTFGKDIHLSKKVFFDDAKDYELRFLLHDKIHSSYFGPDGLKLPVLFDFYNTEKSKNVVIEKRMTVTDLRNFRFSLLRCYDNKPLMPKNDFKKNPIFITLIVYTY